MKLKGNLDTWYFENTLKSPVLYNTILELRKTIKSYITVILENKTEIKELLKEKNNLKKEFKNDIMDFPKDLGSSIKEINEKIKDNHKNIELIEKKLWGTVDREEDGIIWRHDKYVTEYKKNIIEDDNIFLELDNESTEDDIKMIKNKIIEFLKTNNLNFKLILIILFLKF